MSNQNKSASFADIKIKQKPPAGINPTTYYYKTIAPKIDYADDDIFYKYEFLNSNHEAAKKYTNSPVSNYVISSSLNERLLTKYVSRMIGGVALRVRSDQDSSKGAIAIITNKYKPGSFQNNSKYRSFFKYI